MARWEFFGEVVLKGWLWAHVGASEGLFTCWLSFLVFFMLLEEQRGRYTV